MAIRLAVSALALFLSACATQTPVVRTEYQRVEVPVSVRAVAPQALLATIPVPPELKFVSPDDPRASSALTVEGEAALTEWVNEYVARIAAWRAWSAP